jgi:TetR/AcrR family transcriptional regulator, cholesterol catabolism regulator
MPSPPDRPVLRARWERRRREIVATAARLFAERGYQTTSISDLAAATELTVGGLYHYFDGKDDLLIAICDELLEPLLVEAREIGRGDRTAREQLGLVLRAWLEHVASHRHHLLVFSQERQAIERETRWRRVRAQRKEFETLLEEILRRGEKDGSMAFEDRRLSATEIADGYLRIIL